MDTLQDVKLRTRSLIGDPDGDFATDAYIVPLINQAYEIAINKLEATCSPYIEDLGICPNVPQGTTTLRDWQAKDKPLYTLVNPLKIEFKQAGQPDTAYQFAVRMDILPNVSPQGAPPTRGLTWEWRSYVLYVTPMPFACDIRVRGDFKPARLTKDSDLIVIHPIMVAHLSFATAALIGAERQNSNYMQNYGGQAQETFDDISAELVRQQQGTTARLGRANQGGGRRYRGSW